MSLQERYVFPFAIKRVMPKPCYRLQLENFLPIRDVNHAFAMWKCGLTVRRVQLFQFKLLFQRKMYFFTNI